MGRHKSDWCTPWSCRHCSALYVSETKTAFQTWKYETGSQRETNRYRTRLLRLAKTFLKGTVKSKRRRVRQKKIREGNINEWTGLSLEETLILEKVREECRESVTISCVMPQRTNRLRDVLFCELPVSLFAAFQYNLKLQPEKQSESRETQR